MWRRTWQVALGDIPRPHLPDQDGPEESFRQAYKEYCDDSQTAEYIMGLCGAIGTVLGATLVPKHDCDWITVFIWVVSGTIHGIAAGLFPLVGVPCIVYAFAFTVTTLS